jgi:uncharacterized membrane protein YbhN (UPF0104 family)
VAANDPASDPTRPADADAALEADYEAGVTEALEQADHPAKTSRWWSLPLRIIVSVAIIWFVLVKFESSSTSKLAVEWRASTIAWFATALVLTLGAVVLATARWKQVLTAMRVPSPPFRRLLSHYFAGQFVSNVLPTTIGGDVLRAARLARDTDDAPDSFASLIIERLAGWLILPLLCVAGFAANADARSAGHPTSVALTIAFGTVIALAVILFAADHPRLGGRFAEKQGWRRFIGAVHLGVSRIRAHPASAGRVVAAGLVYQFVLVLAAWAGARGLGIDQAGLTAFVAFFPAVLIAQNLPIGISGLGVREGALVFFLAPLGVSNDQAVAIGLLVFALNLVVSLLGAPSFFTGAARRTEPPTPTAGAG